MSTTHKIAVIGCGGVGKSALTLQLVKQQFCEDYDPTIEDSHRTQIEIDGQVSVLEIFDTAGQEELSALRDQAIRAADGFLIVFSLIDASSLREVNSFVDSVKRCKDKENITGVIVGNKCDMEGNRVISTEQIEVLREEMKVPVFEASAKDNINVRESFFELVRAMRRDDEENGLRKPVKKNNKCNIL